MRSSLWNSEIRSTAVNGPTAVLRKTPVRSAALAGQSDLESVCLLRSGDARTVQDGRLFVDLTDHGVCALTLREDRQ